MDQTRTQAFEPGKLVAREVLAAFARGRSEAEFAAACPWPALVFEVVDGGDLTPESDASKPFNIMTLKGGSNVASSAQRFHGLLAFLRKRPGNPFANMISVGRAANTDIALELETISKMHGYFMHSDGLWSYSDRSTNGSTINGVPLKKDEKRALADGDVVRIGTDLDARFLLPKTLRARVLGS